MPKGLGAKMAPAKKSGFGKKISGFSSRVGAGKRSSGLAGPGKK